MIRNPEFSNVIVIKPFDGFERVYQGQPVLSNPIAFPGTLDAFAGQPGYDPNLLAGTPVPMGAEAIIYVPRVLSAYGDAETTYSYTFIWRVRTQQEANDQFGVVGNLGRRLEGIPEATGNAPGKRYVIPAAIDTLVFTETEPTGAFDPATQNVRSLQTKVFGGEWAAPLTANFPPGGTGAAKVNRAGIVSQGLYPNTTLSNVGNDYFSSGWLGGPSYNVFKRQILGNELVVLVSRAFNTGTENWNFAGTSVGGDKQFSAFYGTDNGARPPIPNTGILLFTGSPV